MPQYMSLSCQREKADMSSWTRKSCQSVLAVQIPWEQS